MSQRGWFWVITIVGCLVLWGVVGYAVVEKVSEHTYKIQQDVARDITQVRRFIQSLENDITRKQKEITDLENQIVKLQKEVDDAITAGVKDRTPVEEMIVEGSLTEGGI